MTVTIPLYVTGEGEGIEALQRVKQGATVCIYVKVTGNDGERIHGDTDEVAIEECDPDKENTRSFGKMEGESEE